MGPFIMNIHRFILMPLLLSVSGHYHFGMWIITPIWGSKGSWTGFIKMSSCTLFSFPSILRSLLVSAAEKPFHSMMLPPTWITVWVELPGVVWFPPDWVMSKTKGIKENKSWFYQLMNPLLSISWESFWCSLANYTKDIKVPTACLHNKPCEAACPFGFHCHTGLLKSCWRNFNVLLCLLESQI